LPRRSRSMLRREGCIDWRSYSASAGNT
jgi:hypothetical protein